MMFRTSPVLLRNHRKCSCGRFFVRHRMCRSSVARKMFSFCQERVIHESLGVERESTVVINALHACSTPCSTQVFGQDSASISPCISPVLFVARVAPTQNSSPVEIALVHKLPSTVCLRVAEMFSLPQNPTQHAGVSAISLHQIHL